jgi:hypothetical protein
MSPARRSALLGACRHLQQTRREIARGDTWRAVGQLLDTESDLGMYVGLEMDRDTPESDGRRRYLVVRTMASLVRNDIRVALDADAVFGSAFNREELVRDVAGMLRPFLVTEAMIEERARNISMRFVLESAHRQLGGRRARAMAVRSGRLPAFPRRSLDQARTAMAVDEHLERDGEARAPVADK